jgi:hypothetical protein
LLLDYDMQETSGSVLGAWNRAVALGRNEIVNPDFEVDASNWTASVSITRSTLQAHSGAASGLVTINAQNDFVFASAMPLSSGAVYNIKAWIYLIGAGTVAITGLGAQMTVTQATTSTVGSWVQLSTTGIANETSSTAAFAIQQQSGTSNFYIDDVEFVQTDILASSAYPGSELVLNGNFVNWTADDPDNWTVDEVGDATSNVTENPTGQCQLISDGTAMSIRQSILTTGIRYEYSIQVTTATSGAINAGFGGFNIDLVIDTAQTYTGEFIADGTLLVFNRDGGGSNITLGKVSVKEANPLNGKDTGTTLGIATGTPLKLARRYDGGSTFTNIYSAELNSMFNPEKGSIVCYAKVANAGVWTDGSTRFAVELEADANNRIIINKQSTANDMALFYIAGGTTKVRVINTNTLDFMMLVLTWDTVADEAIVYFNGVQQGAILTGLGTWVGNLLSTKCVIGAENITPVNVWNGDISQTIKLYSEPLPASYVAELYRRSGI